MFGYVLPLQDELKLKEYQYFKGYYCGLCHSLKDNFGNISRLTLNYDLTFISFIIDGLSSSELSFKTVHCLKHLNKKISIINSTDALNYCAYLTIIFTNLKCKDDIEDDHSIKSKAYSLILSPYDKKASTKLHLLANLIQKNTLNLNSLEKSKDFYSLDEISHPFSDTMGNLLKLYPYNFEDDNIELRNLLYDLGYYIGKWIYLIDALDDLKDDMANNKFNPFNILYNKDNLDYYSLINTIITEIDFIILNILTKCSDTIKAIPFKKHYSIIDNIINLGMLNQYYIVLSKINKSIKNKSSNSS